MSILSTPMPWPSGLARLFSAAINPARKPVCVFRKSRGTTTLVEPSRAPSPGKVADDACITPAANRRCEALRCT